jgi:ElaB/YqjD/DUF883 family membrane-anchored ribosome-binding protein
MNDAAKSKLESADLDTLKEEMEALRKNIATIARHLGNGAAGKISEEGHHLYSRLHDGGERVVRAASHEIEERPLTSVLIAFALGFVGGKMLSR